MLNIEEDPYRQDELDAWAEVSARLGSKVLRGFYVDGYGDKIMITRTALPDGGHDFDIEPAPITSVEEPERSWWGRLGEWLRL